MKIVTLVSGGLDSTVMSVLIREEGIEQFPIFIDYGQINREKELSACLMNFQKLGLPVPKTIELSGYGRSFVSGLTDRSKDVVNEAFLPGRNLLFLLCGGAQAHEVSADAVAMGLLDETLSIFPDQRRPFLQLAEGVLKEAIGRPLRIITPLISMRKADVMRIAKDRGIAGTYSCHVGSVPPCGACIACREYIGLEV